MKKKMHIEGMYCHACEVLIERKVKRIDGIQNVSVNRSKKEINFTSSKDIKVSKIQAVLPKKYKVLDDIPEVNSKVNYSSKLTEIGAILIIIFAAYLILQYFNLIPDDYTLGNNMNFGLVFIIGLIASTSTCLAIAGGLLLVMSAKYNEQHPNASGWQRFKPHIFFNAGRVVSYTILGGIIGLIGSTFSPSLFFNGVITITASLFMIIIGVQLLHIFPLFDKLHLKPPKFIAHLIHDKNESKNYSNIGAFTFGGLTFFLPCGFTQALQLYVLTQGSFFLGAITMFIFSLGTLPALASIGLISSFSKGKWQRHFMNFSAVLVIILGIMSLQYGFALVGVHSNDADTNDNIVPIVNGVQLAEMKVTGLAYEPHQFTVKKGIPVKWVVDGTDAVGCGKIMMVPKLDRTEQLSALPLIIEFTPNEVGEIPFSCSMGMTTPGAKIIVIE